MKSLLLHFALAALACFWIACLAVSLWQWLRGEPLSLAADEEGES